MEGELKHESYCFAEEGLSFWQDTLTLIVYYLHFSLVL